MLENVEIKLFNNDTKQQEHVENDRGFYIGGSDIPIIMGLNPFKKRETLLLEKCGMIERVNETNDYIEYGHLAEPFIRDYFNKVQNANCQPASGISKEVDYLRFNVDGIDLENNILLEIKTCSFETLNTKRDEYLKKYYVQLAWYMLNMGFDSAYLVIADRPKDFKLEPEYCAELYADSNNIEIIKVGIDSKTVDDIIKAVKLFIEQMEKLPFAESINDTLPAEFKSKALALVNAFKEFKQMEKHYQDQRELCYQLMSDIGLKSLELEGLKITRQDPTPGSTKQVFDEKRFKKDNPELWAEYQTTKKTNGKKGFIVMKEKSTND